ncbi:J domain-containing protein [Bacteroides acidifaciens]|uniref:J domain-containing protein n=1 Tax=Bacteroides acidifaciens TaxID=85831 RepID=UPI00242D4646|nr:DnaJ domain-containing protein [Bacteroides acidifaciens]
MENFVKTSFELVNGNVVAGTKLMARSLVLVNDNGAMYNITAKVRNTDKFSVIRALTKAVLVSMREAIRLNSTDAAQESKKRVANKIIPALSCHIVMVTDKNGDIIPGSGLSVRDGEKDTNKLRDIVRITRGMPIYKLVVEQGLDWSEETVVSALNAFVTATIEQMDYIKNLDEALGKAADSNESEEKKAENERKQAKKKKNAAKMKKFYKTLGLDENATADEVKNAFREAALKHHPDKGGDAEKFKAINEAYNAIKDEMKFAA